MIERLKENNIKIVITGLKHKPMVVLIGTGLVADIGEENFFRNTEEAIKYIYSCLKAEGKDISGALL